MLDEKDLNKLDGKLHVLKATIDCMPPLRFTTNKDILATILVDDGDHQYRLNQFDAVLFVGDYAINVNHCSVKWIIDVAMLAYLEQQHYRDASVFSHGFIGNVIDFGKLSIEGEGIF